MATRTDAPPARARLTWAIRLRYVNVALAGGLYIAAMFRVSRRSDDDNPANSLGKVVVSLVVMSILFGFGLATLIFRLQVHSRPDAVIPALVLSFAGVAAQFSMVRFLIRRLKEASE